MNTRFVGGAQDGPSFGATAQFFHAEGTSLEFGDVVDPLEGLDDCGVFVPSGLGTVGNTNFFPVGWARFTDGNKEHELEEFSSGSERRPPLAHVQFSAPEATS